MIDNPTMQDVLRYFYPQYLDAYTPTQRQAKAAVHILNCKTGAYGMNISRCETCGHIEYHNNSCRDRSCRCVRRYPMRCGLTHRMKAY